MVSTMTGESLDLTKQNIEKLKELFPEILTDGEKIDFDMLKTILGEQIDGEQERYQFTWHGKRKAILGAQKASKGTLMPIPEKSRNFDTTQNLYIEGDNLEVLKLLQKSYNNKVKLIYIDPPYNTRKDFVYPDDFTDSFSNYLNITGQTDLNGNISNSNVENNGRLHTKWLNMIYPRLKIARNLLTDDGIIFISIDDNEQEKLKLLCNEIFGEKNFVGLIILQTATDNNATQINIEHEYILCYAKDKSKQDYWWSESEPAKLIKKKYDSLKMKYGMDIESIQKELRTWIKENENKLPRVTHYDNVDYKGVFHDGDIANTKFGGYIYDVIHPVTKKICKIPEKGYRYPESTMKKMILEDEILFGKDETVLIKPKKRLENVKDSLRSIIYEDGRGSTKIVDDLLERGVFQNPKSPTVLERIMNFVLMENDIVLDFFAGSATTAHAVYNINFNKDLNVKFILVQLPELLNETNKDQKVAFKYLNERNLPTVISEIGRLRIEKVCEQIESKIKGSNRNLDLGFKFFRLEASNIAEWNVDFESIEEQMDGFATPFVEGRSELDIVYEIMLKNGLELTYPIETFEVEGKTIYDIAYGTLFICLAHKINTQIAKAIIERRNSYGNETSSVIFSDAGFENNDAEKLNCIELLKDAGYPDDSLLTI